MARISDLIENFIKTLLSESEGELELQRNELASYFDCAPSQINYVLSTRFTLSHGYYIESQRGGGGHIRIVRLNVDKTDFIYYLLTEGIGNEISERDAIHIINTLLEQRFITERESKLMKSAIQCKLLGIPQRIKGITRASLLKNMVSIIATEE